MGRVVVFAAGFVAGLYFGVWLTRFLVEWEAEGDAILRGEI